MRRTTTAAIAALMLTTAPAAAQNLVVIEREDLMRLIRQAAQASQTQMGQQAERQGRMDMDPETRDRRQAERSMGMDGMQGATGLGGQDDAYTGPYNFPADQGATRDQQRREQVRRQRDMRDMAERFDMNDDGRVTQEEVTEYRKQRLERFDQNDDGRLSLEEYRALWLDAMEERLVRRFQMHDRDGDGRVTKEEFARATEDFVAMRDRNQDGALDVRDAMSPRDDQPTSDMSRGDQSGMDRQSSMSKDDGSERRAEMQDGQLGQDASSDRQASADRNDGSTN